jgi:hypothetical protein
LAARQTRSDPRRPAECGCSTKHVDQAKPYVLGLFQIAISLLFAHHGDASLFKRSRLSGRCFSVAPL